MTRAGVHRVAWPKSQRQRHAAGCLRRSSLNEMSEFRMFFVSKKLSISHLLNQPTTIMMSLCFFALIAAAFLNQVSADSNVNSISDIANMMENSALSSSELQEMVTILEFMDETTAAELITFMNTMDETEWTELNQIMSNMNGTNLDNMLMVLETANSAEWTVLFDALSHLDSANWHYFFALLNTVDTTQWTELFQMLGSLNEDDWWTTLEFLDSLDHDQWTALLENMGHAEWHEFVEKLHGIIEEESESQSDASSPSTFISGIESEAILSFSGFITVLFLVSCLINIHMYCEWRNHGGKGGSV